jgi:hypothetical protein
VQSNFPLAQEMYQSLLEAKEQSKGTETVELCALLLLMAALEKNQVKDYAKAEALLKRSLAIKVKQYTRYPFENSTSMTCCISRLF